MTGEGSIGFGQPPVPPQPAAPVAALSSPRRQGSVVFTVLLSVAMLLGAAAMALVLIASGAPAALAVGLVLAALPVGPVIAAFLWLDRYEPEPLGLLGFAFGWGALVATTVALLLQVIDEVAFNTPETLAGAITAPLTEEAAKGFFILVLLWSRRHELDGILDGIVYAGLVGVGFAFTENILYLAGAYMGDDEVGPGGLGAATGLFVIRGIFSPFAHPLFTAAIGIGIGVAVVTKQPVLRFVAPVLGYLVAVLTHGLWNASALVGDGTLFLLTYAFAMVPAFFLFVGFAVWARRREGLMLTDSLTDCANRGLLGPHEIPWLVRLPARRACRKNAAAYGGPRAVKVMGEYQQQAIELGFLHNRYLRGTAPSDFALRGSVMVQRLRDLRPYVEFPRARGMDPMNPMAQAPTIRGKVDGEQ